MPVRASGGAVALARLLAHSVRAMAADSTGRRQGLLGRPVDGGPIVAIETGDFVARTRVRVVGCMRRVVVAISR